MRFKVAALSGHIARTAFSKFRFARPENKIKVWEINHLIFNQRSVKALHKIQTLPAGEIIRPVVPERLKRVSVQYYEVVSPAVFQSNLPAFSLTLEIPFGGLVFRSAV